MRNLGEFSTWNLNFHFEIVEQKPRDLAIN